MNVTYIIASLLFVVAGFNVILTQKLPQGKYGAWVNVGNYSYSIGVVFIVFGIVIFYFSTEKGRHTKK